ncbi:TetR/AcrR family transcriptional regulator [Cupriavidus plantarum]|uniref:TetR/AcrR family transcriptional regulator n=1 Tax=Cupriavidus plantarum TaxID=942865 RepID=UPI0015C744ED|nr:TetR/AcrR family transcriptional regulator [Cupriavidus plantarum]NYI00609.1 AcrR family transcriptional regulator [Cupriavidus plantarum]
MTRNTPTVAEPPPAPTTQPDSTPTPARTPARTTYRHGDLRRALLDAGIDLARAGGPEAIVLREATRRAGVVPNAAYRHFANRQDLLEAVRAAALSQLAMEMEAAMEAERATVSPEDEEVDAADAADAATRARAMLRAVGRGYLRYAQRETGLFRTAFSVREQARQVEEDADPAKAGNSGLNPFQLLSAALDGLVTAGLLPSGRRPGAEYLAWAAVHGLAMLALDGPLHGRPAEEIDALSQRLLEMVEQGL